MNHFAAVAAGLGLYLSSGTSMAETAQEDVSSGRASMMLIALLVVVVIVVGKTAIAIGRNKLEKDMAAEKEKADLEARKNGSQPKG